VQQPFANQNGGRLGIGPAAPFHGAMGAGGGGDPGNNAQTPSSPLGKPLAIDVSTGASTVPGCGLRSPWRFSFDSGDLCSGDGGQSAWEVDDRAAGPPAAHYGWSRLEGSHGYDASVVLDPASPGRDANGEPDVVSLNGSVSRLAE
jgi:hypothetical protein